MVMFGSEVMYENGWKFLAIDGQCHYWSQIEQFREVQTGQLSDSQAEQISNRLRLSGWDGYVGEYVSAWCDGPWARYRLDSKLVSLESRCNAFDTSGSIQWLRDEIDAVGAELSVAGASTDGPARVVLVTSEGPASALQYRNAQRWPLSTLASELALTPEQATQYSSLPISERNHLIEPADAKMLWELAAMYRRGEIGADYAQLIPIRDDQGNLYDLFMRDTVPFEDDAGLWQ